MAELPRYSYNPGLYERDEPDEATVSVRCTCPECEAIFREEADVPTPRADDNGYWIYDGKAGTAIAFVENRDVAELVVQRLNEGENARRLVQRVRQRNPRVAELWSENGL